MDLLVRRSPRGMLALWLLGCFGCSGAPLADAGDVSVVDAALPIDAAVLDAERDAPSAPDAGSDVGSDIGSDAGSDAGTTDVGTMRDAGRTLCALEGVTRIVAAADHTCAVVGAAGEPACWGRPDFHQLGVGTPLDPDRMAMPLHITDAPEPTLAVANASELSCFQSIDTFACCGTDHGALPEVLTGITGGFAATFPYGVYAAFGGIGGHMCVRAPSADDTFLVCIGRNDANQLGRPSTTPGDFFRAYAHLDRIEASAGLSHTCALNALGTVHCWGSNDDGQLGRAAAADTGVEILVTLPRNAEHVAAGGYHACASLDDGSLSCWGSNTSGQLGIGDATLAPVGPTSVSGLPGPVDEVHAGLEHTCARVGGDLYCWGSNAAGQLGTEGIALSPSPVRVALPEATTLFATGSLYTCAVGVSSRVWCFGENIFGQLGDGTDVDRSVPTQVVVPCERGIDP